MAVIGLNTESCVFEGLGYSALEQDGLLLCVGVRQCALPPAPGTQETQVATSVPTAPPEGRAPCLSAHSSGIDPSGTLVPGPHSSRTTSRLALSGRRPRKLGCLRRRSGVQLVKATSATRSGSTQ
jgi:hypothetical protein